MSRHQPQFEVTDGLIDDGRNVDQSIGTLSGEASAQVPIGIEQAVALRSQAFPYIPSRQPGVSPTYYDHPMLKRSTWIWSIPTYFYVGGVAGVGATFGAAAQLVAPKSMALLIKRAHWIGTTGGAISAALLIHDLGRPERFLNMLRVFRPSSPMSMGSWILSLFSTCIGGAAVLPYGPKFLRILVQPLGLLAGLLGLGLSGYTGVLISQTAVPVWQESYRTMPIMFLASGTAAAAAFFEFFESNQSETNAIERFGLMGKIIELLSSYILERDASRVERVGRPLKQGFSGFLWQSAKVLTVAGIILTLAPGKGRKKRIASGVIGTAASLCLRFGIFHAGHASTDDSRASFDQQRQHPPEKVDLRLS